MRKNYFTVYSICFILLCMLLSGCEKVSGETEKISAEELVMEMRTANENQKITYEIIDVKIDASYGTKMEGFSMSAGFLMGLELEQWISPDPFASYSKGTMTLEALNQDYVYKVEDYRLVEEGKIVAYTYDGMTDEWGKEESAIAPLDYHDEYFTKVAHLEPDFENASLQEDTEMVGEREAYVLLGECSGEDVKELLYHSGLFQDFEFRASVETFKEIKIPVSCYVDTESLLILQMELEPSAMEELVKLLFADEMDVSEDSEQEYVINVEECYLKIKDMNYEPQKIPQVPENAKDSFSILDILEFAGGHLGDGSYLLISGSKVGGMDYSILEGYKVIEYIAEHKVTLQSKDESKIIIFEAMSEAAAHQYFENTEDVLKTLIKELGVERKPTWKTEKIMTHLGETDVYGMCDHEGLVLYNTLISTDHISVCISAFDMAGEWDDAASVIVPLTDALSEVTVDTLPFMGYGRYADFDGAAMLQKVAEAVSGKQVSYAEARFSDYGIYLLREKGIGIEATHQNSLSAEIFGDGFLQWNDRVSLGLFSGKDMYSLTVLYPGEEILDIIDFCSPVLMEQDITAFHDALTDAQIITYFVIDPDTNLPVQIMFDISEMDGLLQINKKYFILDKIKY